MGVASSKGFTLTSLGCVLSNKTIKQNINKWCIQFIIYLKTNINSKYNYYVIVLKFQNNNY